MVENTAAVRIISCLDEGAAYALVICNLFTFAKAMLIILYCNFYIGFENIKDTNSLPLPGY